MERGGDTLQIKKRVSMGSRSRWTLQMLSRSSFETLRCSHWTWWINRSAITQPLSGCFSSVSSPDRPPHPGVRLHASAASGTFTHLWLERLSSGNWRQGIGEHLVSRPSSGGSAGSHGRCTLSVAVCHQFATLLSWLHERHSQRFGYSPSRILLANCSRLNRRCRFCCGYQPSEARDRS
jgi:hypothetical protein